MEEEAITSKSPDIKLNQKTIEELRKIKKLGKKVLKNYDDVINHLLKIRIKYFKLKNKI